MIELNFLGNLFEESGVTPPFDRANGIVLNRSNLNIHKMYYFDAHKQNLTVLREIQLTSYCKVCDVYPTDHFNCIERLSTMFDLSSVAKLNPKITGIARKVIHQQGKQWRGQTLKWY